MAIDNGETAYLGMDNICHSCNFFPFCFRLIIVVIVVVYIFLSFLVFVFDLYSFFVLECCIGFVLLRLHVYNNCEIC